MWLEAFSRTLPESKLVIENVLIVDECLLEAPKVPLSKSMEHGGSLNVSSTWKLWWNLFVQLPAQYWKGALLNCLNKFEKKYRLKLDFLRLRKKSPCGVYTALIHAKKSLFNGRCVHLQDSFNYNFWKILKIFEKE